MKPVKTVEQLIEELKQLDPKGNVVTTHFTRSDIASMLEVDENGECDAVWGGEPIPYSDELADEVLDDIGEAYDFSDGGLSWMEVRDMIVERYDCMMTLN